MAGWLHGVVWVHADSFLRCVASHFHSFVTTCSVHQSTTDAEYNCRKQCRASDTICTPNHTTTTYSPRGASCLSLRPHLRRVVTLCVCRYWVVTRLVTGCVRPRPCVRETCVRGLDAAWGVTICRIILSFARVCRVGVWFGFVGSALLLAVRTCVVV